ncbi:hypothetical protein ANO11243_007620 [Dothideomycetidae sp. 11243]|nr:hypothetical protein ANO11243_007620 [fungal sp. No.11243]
MAEVTATTVSQSRDAVNGSPKIPAPVHPPCIVRSQPLLDIEPFIQYLWNTDPAMCLSVYTDLFPRGVNGQGATQAEEDAFIRQFFDEHTFWEQGPRFLKYVLYYIAVYNDSKVVPAAQRYEHERADFFADESMVNAMLQTTTTRAFFDEHEVKLYENDQHLLERVMKAVQHKIRYMRTHQSLYGHHEQKPQFQDVNWSEPTKKPNEKEAPVSPKSHEPSVVPGNSDQAVGGAVIESTHRVTKSEGDNLPQIGATGGEQMIDAIVPPKPLSSDADLPASDLVGEQTTTLNHSAIPESLAYEAQKFTSAATQTANTQITSAMMLRDTQAHSQEPVLSQAMEIASSHTSRSSERRNSTSSRGSRGSTIRARGRGRGSYHGPPPTHVSYGRGMASHENRPFIAQPHQNQHWRYQEDFDFPRNFDQRSMSDGMVFYHANNAPPGYIGVAPPGSFIGPNFPVHVAGQFPDPRFGHQPSFNGVVPAMGMNFQQAPALPHSSGIPAVQWDEIAVRGLPADVTQQEIRVSLSAHISPSRIRHVIVRNHVAFVK